MINKITLKNRYRYLEKQYKEIEFAKDYWAMKKADYLVEQLDEKLVNVGLKMHRVYTMINL